QTLSPADPPPRSPNRKRKQRSPRRSHRKMAYVLQGRNDGARATQNIVLRLKSHARLWALDQIGRGQAAVQRGWHSQSVDGETFLQSFPQTGGRHRVLLLQPGGELSQPGHSFF